MEAMNNFQFTIDSVHQVCCVGAGRVGVFTMLVLAQHWPNKQFIVVDSDKDLIAWWANPAILPPFYEPNNALGWDLQDLLAKHRNVNLFFGDNIEQGIRHARMIVIAVDVPLINIGGKRMKNNLDTSHWMNVLNTTAAIAREQGTPKYVVEKSTMPIQFECEIDQLLQSYGNNLFQIVSNPEFFCQGTAIQDLMNPSRVVIANKFQADVTLLHDLYMPVVGGKEERILLINSSQSATLGKLISSALFACNMAVMNAASSLCERISGANFREVKNIVRIDGRVCEGFLDSSIGYDSLNLNKDVAYLAYIADYLELYDEAQFFKDIFEMNQEVFG